MTAFWRIPAAVFKSVGSFPPKMRKLAAIALAAFLSGPASAAPPSPAHARFLKDAEPIITKEEREIFLNLEEDHHRERFIEQFWRRRDQPPGGRNEFREEYEQLLSFADASRLRGDARQILLLRGSPAAIVPVSCADVRKLQVWAYGPLPRPTYHPQLSRIGSSLDPPKILFVDYGVGNWRLWDGDLGAFGLFGNPGDQATLDTLRSCPNSDAVFAALRWSQLNKADRDRFFERPKLTPRDAEGVASSLESFLIQDPAMPALPAEVTTVAVGRRGHLTLMDVTAVIPREALKTGDGTYRIDTWVEVLRDGHLFDNLRSNFPIRASDAGERVAVTIPLKLEPGEYELRARLVASGAQALYRAPFIVPRTTMESAPVVADLPVIDGATALHLIPPPSRLLTGQYRFETLVTGAIDRVDFLLDGKSVALKQRPPFTLEFNLGPLPERHVIRAIGYSGDAVVAGDEMIVNEPRTRFGVRIDNPRVRAEPPVRVDIAPTVPAGESLDSVTLSVNDREVAVLRTPPYTVVLPSLGAEVPVLKATARLASGEEAEDAVILNAPYLEQLVVRVVEVPVTALDEHGRPVLRDDLCGRISLLDAGVPVKEFTCAYERTAPLAIGLALDTSQSMEDDAGTLRDVASGLVAKVLRPQDQAFLVTFNTQVEQAAPWTKRADTLVGAISRLRTTGGTALYDAIVTSLAQFPGVTGRKALIVVSDGDDVQSRFSPEAAKEAARRAGVPVYAIHIGDGRSRRIIKKIATGSGGRFVALRDARELPAAAASIEEELRSQYLLTFHTETTGNDCRPVQVVLPDGLRARTIACYVP